MIDKDSVGWVLLVDNLNEANEHLGNLTAQMVNGPDFSEEEFAIHLGHIYAHMNRAWNLRNVEAGINSESWDSLSQFPMDIKPVG
jgi:hypothetical protein